MKTLSSLSSRIALVGLFLVVGVFLWAATGSRGAFSQEPSPAEQNAAAHAPNAPSATLFSYQGQLLDSAGNPITNAAMPMTFYLYTTATGGTTCWTESQTVNVEDGRFNVLLGQTVAFDDDACFTGDAYLELVVNGETLSPRELLTSVAYAVEAGTVTAGARTRGNLNVEGVLEVINTFNIRNSVNSNYWHMPYRVGGGGAADELLISHCTYTTQCQWVNVLKFFSNGLVLVNAGNLDLANHDIVNVNTITTDGLIHGGGNLTLDGSDTAGYAKIDTMVGRDLNILRDQAETLILKGGANGSGSVVVGASTQADPVDLTVHGHATIKGDLTVEGNCNVTASLGGTIQGISLTGENATEACRPSTISSDFYAGGGYIETLLMTAAERAAGRIDRFSQGDVQCWSPETQRLELCNTANNRLAVAVADPYGRPIILGVEPIKVIGPVQAGDLLVASDTPGYAMVNNDPAPGTVIGQALEDFDGESGLIKAMIRKW